MAFIGVFAVCGLSVYHFGKTYFGRSAGFLAALFYLLDRGQYREGGWNYTVWWGVWPQILSTAFTLLSLSTLQRVLTRGRARDYGICALCCGFAILSHPVAVIYFGLAVPIYLIARVLGTEDPAGRIVVRTMAALGLGALLAAFWLLPFMAKGAWMAKYGELLKSLPSMASGLWEGTLFDNLTPPLVWLGVLGGAVAAWRRNFAGIFLLAFAAVVLFLSSSTAFQKLELINISPAFGQVQFQRLSIPGKVCIFLLAGFALQVAFARLSKGSDAAAVRFSWRRYALVALLLLTVSPFVEPVMRQWGKTYGGNLGRPKTRKDFSYWDDYQKFLAWSKELGKTEKEHFRIAYVRPYNDHFFAAAPIYNGLLAYKVGFTPCTNFIHKPDTADPSLYRHLSVKYVVAIGRPGGPNLKLEKRFGPIQVYRNLAYSPQRYTLKGPGRVEVETFDRERVRLKISGASSESQLILHRAIYPNWRAEHDGEPLEISAAALGTHKIFLSVPAQNGTIEFRYAWPAVNILGSLLSWLAIGILLSMVVCRFRPAVAQRLRERLMPMAIRAERHGLLVGLGLLLVPVLLLLVKPGHAEKVDPNSLLARLDQVKVEMLRGSQVTDCPRKRDRFQCSNKSWNYVGPASYRIDAQFRRCLWAHPVEGSKLRLRLPKAKIGRAISGHHGLLDDAVRSFSNGSPVSLEVAIDGKLVKTFVRPNRKGWAHFRLDTADWAGKTAEVSFTVHSARAGGRHYCFEASIEP